VLSLTVGKGVWDAKSKRGNPWTNSRAWTETFRAKRRSVSPLRAQFVGRYDWSNTNKVWTTPTTG